MYSISGTSLLMEGETKTESGLYTFGTISAGTIPTTASTFAPGCEILDLSTGIKYTNTGTTASPSWTNEDTTLAGDLTIAGTLTANGNTVIGNAAGDTLTLTATLAGKIPLALNGGAASASGILMGVGTTANPATTSTADTMFAEFRTRSSATSGATRGLYWRHEMTGAGASGEALRAFNKVSAAVDTARGTQISLDVNTTGSVTGLGVGVDAQILVPNQALGGGTYGVINSEIYSAGSSSSVAASDIAFFRVVAGGDATGAGTVDSGADLFSIQGLTAGASNLFRTGLTAATVNAATTAALRIKVGGTDYFIPLATATA